MTTLPKLALIPSGYKASKVYSALPTNGDGDFTFSRTGTATRVNENGLIETVDSNVPRLDYLDSNCPSLLLEPQRTNLITYSEDFTQWNSSRGTLDVNNTISPTGSLNGGLYTKTESGNEGYVLRDLNVLSVGTYTASVFFKYNNNQYVHFLLWDGSSNGVRCYFDIQNGNVGSAIAFGTTFSASDLSMEDYGNGWYKCSAKFTTTGTDTIWQFRFSPSGGNNSSNSNTGAKFYFFGAQVEQGSYPTSYIPTEGSTVTRNKDVCINAGNADLFDITEGTFFVDANNFGTPLDGYNMITISDGTANNFVRFLYESSRIRVTTVSSGVTQIDSIITGVNSNERNKVAITFKYNEVKVYLNGVLKNTDTSNVLPVGMDRLNFSSHANTRSFEGKVYDTRVYNTVLTETEAIQLTNL